MPGRSGTRQAEVRLVALPPSRARTPSPRRSTTCLHNHALEVVFTSPDRPKAVGAPPVAEAIKPVGLRTGRCPAAVPGERLSRLRLLTEYFAYPAKFLYVDLAGWDAVRAALGAVKTVDVVIFLDRSHGRLEQLLDPSMLRLGCTPAVNLFEWTAEPIPLTHTKPEYKLVPEVGHPTGYEVFGDHRRDRRRDGWPRRRVPALLPFPPRRVSRRPARVLVRNAPARARPTTIAERMSSSISSIAGSTPRPRPARRSSFAPCAPTATCRRGCRASAKRCASTSASRRRA